MKKNLLKRPQSSSHMLTIIILAAGFAGIYGFTDMKASYYSVMKSALALSEAQLGTVFGAFGITAAASYLIGGWLADRLAPVRIITAAFASAGMWHLLLALIPGYHVQVILSGLMGISAVLLFFPSSTKLLTALSKSQAEQRTTKAPQEMAQAERTDNTETASEASGGKSGEAGRMFGFYYAISGVFSFVFSIGAALLYEATGNDVLTFRIMMICFGLLCCSAAVLVNTTVHVEIPEETGGSIVRRSEIRSLLASPSTWLISFIILCTYLAFRGLTYLQPYLTDVCGMKESLSVTLSVLRNNLLLPVACVLFGELSRRKGAASFAIGAGMLLVAAASAALIGNEWLAGSTFSGGNIATALVLITIFTAGAAGAKNIGMGLISEAGIPLALTGTAVGIISLIGYSPDIFLFPLVSRLLIAFGNRGYTILFVLLAVAGATAVCACSRMSQRDVDESEGRSF